MRPNREDCLPIYVTILQRELQQHIHEKGGNNY
jgi:hypothetical protein